MYDLEQTGKCVKRLRKNMTQQEFAEQVNISLDTVRKIEQGRRGMSIDILIEIADFLMFQQIIYYVEISVIVT